MRLRARAVLAAKTGTALDAVLHRVPVIGVDMAVEADEVVRAEVFDPEAFPRATVTIGRRTARLTIKQEVYGDIRPHLVLLRACPVRVVMLDAEDGVVESDPSARGETCTVRVIEVGGNVYDIERALGVCEVEGSPGERMTFTFTLVGELVRPTDYVGGRMAIVPIPQPLIYRSASIVAPRLGLGSCPAFTFTGGGEVGTIDTTCDPEGGKMAYVQRSAAATLELAGVLARKESVDRVWETAREPLCDETVTATLYQDGAAELRLSLQETAIVLPEMVDVEGFAGYDVSIGGCRWMLVWEGFADQPWSPLELEPLVWLDPSDRSTLFINSAGTQPVQFSGDPVGLWVNKGTLGAVGDAAQAVSASRPAWTGAGGGMIALESGQTMTTGHVAEMPFSAAVGWMRSPSMTAAGHMLTAGGAGIQRWNINSQPMGVGALGPHLRTARVSYREGAAYAAWSMGSLKIRTLENQNENSTTVAPFTPQPTSIGFSYTGDVGHVFVFDRELTDEESTKLLTWMEAVSVY